MNSSFTAKQKGGQVKTDFYVCHNEIEKCVSVKKGGGNSVHQEKVSVFFPYIEKLLGDELSRYIKLFHFGDGTEDGTGKERCTANEMQKKCVATIKKINEKINEKAVLVEFLERFLFVGNVGKNRIDAIYHGTIESGTWASRDEIIEYFCQFTYPSKTICFGSLTYQVWGRDHNETAKNPHRRYTMQVKWGRIRRDLSAIRRCANE